MRPLTALAEDRRGVALIEFAFTFPILLLLFLGGYQLADAVACKRKVGLADRTIVDLASTPKMVTAAELETILESANAMLAPYPGANASVRISQVAVDARRRVSIVWSRGSNVARRTRVTTAEIPRQLRVANTYLVMGEVAYAYDPGVAYRSVGKLNFSDRFFMNPRNSNMVVCNDCR
ncbi:TadE/TadG family type IV pilus assembly protein [Sphingomonas sp.]|uniref:TadE/TadG family type IV pilus assembly protein n=1 Tax=Sphingomonas sp. TaxID=28214 RepID=UPI0035B2B1FE